LEGLPFDDDSFAATFADFPWVKDWMKNTSSALIEMLRVAPVAYIICPWLVGASSDPRVVALAPMVIDVLNLPVNLNYQIEVWKDYSDQIEDYVKLGIPQGVESESGKNITTMVICISSNT